LSPAAYNAHANLLAPSDLLFIKGFDMKDKLLLAVLIASLAGCNSDSVKEALDIDDSDDVAELDSGSAQSDTTDSSSSFSDGSFSSVAGIYAYPDYWDDDEGYVVISADGSYSEYDYAGDGYGYENDEYGNCYWIDEEFLDLAPVSSNRYDLVLFDSTIATIEFTNDGFRYVFDGELPYDELTFKKVSNVSVSDFTPDCDYVL
jgi:hypothetical protein